MAGFVQLSVRRYPGKSRSECFLHLEEGGFIRVDLSRPEEPSQAIFSPSRHQMNMQMENALADRVVDADKSAFGV